MKKRLIVFLALVSFCFCFVCDNFNSAHADALTMSMIVNSVYAITQTSGLDWVFSGMNGNDVKTYLEDEINIWLGSSTIAEKFGTEAVRLELGKYIVGAQLYNGIVDFLSSFSEKNLDYYGDNNLVYVKIGTVNYIPAGVVQDGENTCRAAYQIINTSTGQSKFVYGGQWFITQNVTNDGLEIENTGRVLRIYGKYSYDYGSKRSNASSFLGDALIQDSKTVNVQDTSYIAPTVIDPSQAWVGQFYGVPDTNLDDLIYGAFEDLADNNLDVDGEVTNPPGPQPTPVPVDPDTPLSDVPWGGLDDSLTGIDTNLGNLYNQGLEEIGAIGDAQDAITDAIGQQTGVIDQAIANNAGFVSGAINQAVSDIQTAIGEQTAALDDSLSATAEATGTIAEALEDEAIDWKKFDLRGLFPFCIPFDIYNMLEALDASPTAPHVQLPFVIESIGFSYTIDLDFSAFDQVASVMRQMELIVYGIALAWATSKVIKW